MTSDALQAGRTPLWKAADGGHTSTVEALLAKEAEVDCRDKYGEWRTGARARVGVHICSLTTLYMLEVPLAGWGSHRQI